VSIKNKYELVDSKIAWIGGIPATWKLVRMKHLFRDHSEKNRPNEELLSVTQDKGVIPRANVENRMVMPTGALNSFKFIQKGDFAISLRSFEGGLEYCYHDGLISPAYTVLKAKKTIDSRYFKYLFKSLSFISEIQTSIVGIREGKNISYPELSYSFVPFPSITEQTAIANFLDQKTALIDKAIAIKERQIELLKERRQILIQQAVTKGLDPNVEMKDSGVEWIPEVPATWRVVRLKYFASIQTGLTLGKTFISQDLKSFPYLRVANIQYGYTNLDDISEIQLPTNLASKYRLKKDDILVTEGGDIDKLGRGTIWNGQINDCLHQNHVFAIRPKIQMANPKFISFVMESSHGRKYFTNTANKTTNLASTNSTKLGNFPIPVPPLWEQEIIVNYIEIYQQRVKQSIDLINKEIESLKEHKSTLINSAVTGKIKVA
jgi:type I restriction enzyme S subunit